MIKTYLFINWQIGKKNKWYIQKVKHYSAIKQKEVLIHATTWMNLETIM